MIGFGLVIAGTLAGSSAASADPLGAGDGTIYRLNPESTYEHGCFEPCMCPVLMQTGIRGTLELTYNGSDEGGHAYSVTDVNWTIPINEAELRVFGSGRLQIGSPGPPAVIQYRLQLDLQIGDEPIQHFDSGWVMHEQISGIDITVSINGIYCWDTVFTIDADPVPNDQIQPYTLLSGSTFQRGCYNPCDCLLWPELPMIGTFSLITLEQNSFFTEYAVVDIDWQVLAGSIDESFPITGLGAYHLQAEFAVQHRMGLELVVAGEERTHFDSGMVVGGSEFPTIDIFVSIHGIYCYDTVLHIVAQPETGEVCGGFGGLPCEDGEFCKLPVGACCCDQFGVCTSIPSICPTVYNPVCGCDGNTYGNECEADGAGMSIDHYGECAQRCLSSQDCPAANHFCKFPEGTCGMNNEYGVCTPLPVGGCPEIYDPLCGCDGVTYINECESDAAGVSVRHRGECMVPACAATRVLSDPDDLAYCPGVTKRVDIVLNPPGNVSAIAIEDTPPAGWVVSNISDGGTFDAVNRKVKWGPLFPPFPAVVSYDATPTDASGIECFTGTISIDGVNEPICGDECIDVCCPHIPADAPQPECPECPVGDCNSCDGSCRNGQVSMCELVGYACAWMGGCNDDMAGMTRAAYIWRNGECYCWDDAERNWFPASCTFASVCCDGGRPGPQCGGDSQPACLTGAATARFHTIRSGRLSRVRELKVPITVEAPEGTSAMALECNVPQGWQVTDISDSGMWEALHRKVKWGPFMDNPSPTVSFRVRQISTVPTSKARRLRNEGPTDGFTGTVSFDGANHPITTD